jgi:hypothetical protein
MADVMETLFKNQIRFYDERYLESLKRLRETREMNGLGPDKKLDRKIYAIEGINSGKIRFHPYAVNSKKMEA